MSVAKNFNNIVETLISIFTLKDGLIKVLLFKKNVDPYKGYWVLPNSILGNNETLEDNVSTMVYEKSGLKNIDFEQLKIYSSINRDPNVRIIGVSYISLVSDEYITLTREERNRETEWFDINTIPKLGYDHDSILTDSIEFLKLEILKSNVLKKLFPSDFTLPELQKIYEQVLDKKLDRRNFRKKFINFGLIEEVGQTHSTGSGRPAKLYRFKDNIKNINIF